MSETVTLEALLDRVEKLEDQLAIMRLVAAYGPAADSGSAAAAQRRRPPCGPMTASTTRAS